MASGPTADGTTIAPEVAIYLRVDGHDEIEVGHATDTSDAGLAAFFRAVADELEDGSTDAAPA